MVYYFKYSIYIVIIIIMIWFIMWLPVVGFAAWFVLTICDYFVCV